MEVNLGSLEVFYWVEAIFNLNFKYLNNVRAYFMEEQNKHIIFVYKIFDYNFAAIYSNILQDLMEINGHILIE